MGIKTLSGCGPRDGSQLARRAAYSLAAGAATGLAANAEAKIVVSGFSDLPVTLGNYRSLKFDSDQYIDLYLRNYGYQDGNYQSLKVEFAAGKFVGKRANNINYVRALDAGFEVNATNVNYFTGSLAKGTFNPNAEFNNAVNKYIGVAFPISGDGSPDNYYGWLRVSIDNAAGTFVVHAWAYENVLGQPIKTGDMGPAGDFNNDGKVDAADYTVWRDNKGTSFDLAGNGDNLGTSLNVVDQDDFGLWKANFGWVAPAGVGAAAAALPVPEPTLGFLAAGSAGVLLLRRRRRE